VRFLIVPIFLCTNIIYFPSLTEAEFRRLELAFEACTRYVDSLRRFDHISEFTMYSKNWKVKKKVKNNADNL
jgi:hypothetical protein